MTRVPEWPYPRVLAKMIRLKNKTVYRAKCISFGLYTECFILLATPYFPYVQETSKNNSPGLATPKNGIVENLLPPKMIRVQNLGVFGGGELWTLPFFGGGKFWTLPFLGVASSGLCYFLDSGT